MANETNRNEKVFNPYQAAEQGNAEAQYNLGIAYYNGVGVKQDSEKSGLLVA